MQKARSSLMGAGFRCLAALLLGPLAVAPVAAKPVALLVGVGQYQSPDIRALEGPPHDVAALRQTLTGRWGFTAGDVRTLLDGQATRANILAELDALEGRSKPGDLVFVYFSGHGTSAQDSHAQLPLPQNTGAFIPVDMPAEGRAEQLMAKLIIGQRDLHPRLKALERGGRQVLVVADSCYSGQAVRALGVLPSRYQPLRVRGGPARDEIEMSEGFGNRPPAPPYPYAQVSFLAAASDSEQAADIDRAGLKAYPTVDGKPHGAFTDALLQVLAGKLPADADRDGTVSRAETFEAVTRFMAQRGFRQTPQMQPAIREDRQQLASRALFDATPAQASVPAAATAQDIEVRLEAGAEPLRASLRGRTGLRLDGNSPDFGIRPGKACGGESWELLDRAGDRVVCGDESDMVRRLQAETWLRKMQALADKHRRFGLSLEADPATRGGTFMAGETLAFVTRAERAGHLLLLDLDGKGQITVLYPYRKEEMAPIAGGQVVMVPGEGPQDRIRVTPPFGSDRLLAFVFPEATSVLASLRGKAGLDVDDADLRRLAELLDGKVVFGAASFGLRTLPDAAR